MSQSKNKCYILYNMANNSVFTIDVGGGVEAPINSANAAVVAEYIQPGGKRRKGRKSRKGKKSRKN